MKNTYIAVRTGSKNEPAETTGLPLYLEHRIFNGSDKFGVNFLLGGMHSYANG